MNYLWEWGQLCEALEIDPTSGPNISGIHFDSRLIQSGDLFVPLSRDSGDRFNISTHSSRDGHDFIDNAIQNGAVATLSSQNRKFDIPTLKVRDTLEALWQLARFRREQLKCPVIAITGSSGKTTFKYFLSTFLEIPIIEGSFNNHIGLPLSIALTPQHQDFAVFEIGTNHVGEIAPLSQLARPNIAVVLNVLDAHIGNFGSYDDLFQEKYSICRGLEPPGTLVLRLVDRPKVQSDDIANYSTFGFEKAADVVISSIGDTKYQCSTNSESIVIDVRGGGKHRAETLAACGATLQELGQPIEILANSTKSVPPGRGVEHSVRGVKIIDDSYNASPTSMYAALTELSRQSSNNRRIAILGQMNELGDKSKLYHDKIRANLTNIDIVYCVGALMEDLFRNLDAKFNKYYFEVANEELIQHVKRRVRSNDVVLVKGSNTVFWQKNFVTRLITQLNQL